MTSRNREEIRTRKRLRHSKRHVKVSRLESEEEKILIEIGLSDNSKLRVKRTRCITRAESRYVQQVSLCIVLVAVIVLCLIRLDESECSLSDLIALIRVFAAYLGLLSSVL